MPGMREREITRAPRCANVLSPSGDHVVTQSQNIYLAPVIDADAEQFPRAKTCAGCGRSFTAFLPIDRLCLACLERAERAEALGEQCRIHRVRYVEDLPVSVLQEMQAERGRC